MWTKEGDYLLFPDTSSNQGNQDSSGNQKRVSQGQRPDIGSRQTQQRT